MKVPFCLSVCNRERERERVSECVCVGVGEREIERERDLVKETVCLIERDGVRE